MHADCAAPAGSFPSARAKISNDLLTLPGQDGRSAIARRYRDLVRAMLKDLGVEQADLSETVRLQVRSTARLALKVEELQARAEQGKPVDLLALVRMQNSLARALWSLGLGRRRRQTLTPEDPLAFARRHKEQARA